MKIVFKKSTLALLDKTFSLKQVETLPYLDAWLASQEDISDYEQQSLQIYQQNLKKHVHDWNEAELSYGFIGPMMTLVNFSDDRFGFFAQRNFEGSVDGVELAGIPDGIIASGFREPEKPYFCFQEYKRENDPEGDPAGQVLAAMLLAQAINEHQHPIYGCYVKGAIWYFVVLQGREYAISSGYVATRDDIDTIFCVLKALKGIIARLIEGNKM
ncbi:MAG: hypothetical protein AAF639_17355 [Chloroflexota bacterium]